jgi:Type II CAAX prenyl endopeptidase Rce1-like
MADEPKIYEADPVNETNVSDWTPIDHAPPLSPNGTVPSSVVEPSESAQQTEVGSSWTPASIGPEGNATSREWMSADGSQSTDGSHLTDGSQSADGSQLTNRSPRADGGLSEWVPANQPGVIPGSGTWTPTTLGEPGTGPTLTTNLSATTKPSTAPGTAAAAVGKTEEVRHGGPFSRNAWRWSLAAVAAIIGIIALAQLGLSRFIDQFESGTPQRLAVICASLFTNDAVMIGVLIVVARRMGMSFRSFGIRRPADVKESIVLAFAAWLIFILLAGIWALVSQSATEREANNPFLRDRTVNARDSSATSSTDLTDAGSSETPSADKRSDKLSTGEASEGTTTDVKQDAADNRHALIKVLNDNPPKALLISILITGCIGAPLLEELLVRGFLFGAFSQRFGKLAGGAISSLLFGFAHIMAYPLKMIPPLVVMGVALAWLAWQTGSILPGMFIHAFVNSLGLGIAASLGGHILTLMVGSWLALGVILLPWIRSKPQPVFEPS